MNRLEILVSEREDTIVLSLSGSADMGEAELLNQHLEKEFSQGRYKMVIDLSDLEFTSSMGLGSLIRAHTKCRQEKGRLSLVNPQPAVMKVIQTTHLNELFNIYQTLDEAMQG
jgi:anti-sigma B factor antagonist